MKNFLLVWLAILLAVVVVGSIILGILNFMVWFGVAYPKLYWMAQVGYFVISSFIGALFIYFKVLKKK